MDEKLYGLFEKAVTGVQEINGKEKQNNIILTKPAKVIAYDDVGFKATVYFIDDAEQTAYILYNKTGEILSEGDNVRVYYTTNPAKGWIGMRSGTPNIPECEGEDTFIDAIILTQKDLGYLIHSYKVVEYFKGFQTLALGVDTSIVINGYIATDKRADASMYGSISWSELPYDTADNTVTGVNYTVEIVSSHIDDKKRSYVYLAAKKNGKTQTSQYTRGAWGLIITFSTVYAPTAGRPYGFARCDVYLRCTTSNGETEDSIVGSGNVAFASIEEYEAAIRLYKEPYYGSDVIKTTVVDDGSTELEAAMQYTDAAVEALRASLTNTADTDRQQIQQNTGDISALSTQTSANTTAISDIKNPDTGILAQSKQYTDIKIDNLQSLT